MHSAHNSNTFLAYYNQIDKYLSYILWLTKYVPYHERITIIGKGWYKISHFVKKFEGKLRYFWDLRNQLVHGFRLDNKHYVIVSDHAIKQISMIHDELTKPQTIAKTSKWDVFHADISDTLEQVIQTMSKDKIHYLPVFDKKDFVWVLSFQDILSWLSGQNKIDTSKATLADVKVNSYIEHDFVSEEMSVHELKTLFSKKDWAEVILATPSGKEGEEISALVSVYDLVQMKDLDLQVNNIT